MQVGISPANPVDAHVSDLGENDQAEWNLEAIQTAKLLAGQSRSGVTTMKEKISKKIEVAYGFVKKNPKKIAAVILALLSTLSPESQEVVKAIIEALVQSAV